MDLNSDSYHQEDLNIPTQHLKYDTQTFVNHVSVDHLRS